jgi:uncharacterized membrane protein (UPF0127 family)
LGTEYGRERSQKKGRDWNEALRHRGSIPIIVGAIISLALSKTLGTVLLLPFLFTAVAFGILKRRKIPNFLVPALSVNIGQCAWIATGLIILLTVGAVNEPFWNAAVELPLFIGLIAWVWISQSRISIISLLLYQSLDLVINLVQITTEPTLRAAMFIHALMRLMQIATTTYAFVILRKTRQTELAGVVPSSSDQSTEVDSRARSGAAELTQPPKSHKKQNYFTRHWRGELSLPISYWLNGTAASIGSIFVIVLIKHVTDFKNDFYPAASLSSMIGIWIALSIIITWQAVGVWRSAKHYQRSKKVWGGVAQFFVVIGVLRAITDFALHGAPEIGETFKIYMGDEEVGKHAFRVLQNGKELEFSGGITFGTAKEFRQFLDAMPDVNIVRLESHGGRILEAQRIGDLIKIRRLDTYVSDDCLSACTIVFLSGTHRLIEPRAKLGFHQPDFPGLTDEERRLIIDNERARLLNLGVSALFAEKALSTPPTEMWVPTPGKLLDEHIVTRVIYSADPNASPQDYLRGERQVVDSRPIATPGPTATPVDVPKPVATVQVLESAPSSSAPTASPADSQQLSQQKQAAAQNAPTFKRSKLIIATKKGPQLFTVELALTREQQTWGTRFREAMSPDLGMFYVYERPRIGSQRMDDTVLPLDVLFISPDGHVAQIVSRAPRAEGVIKSETSVLAMLELNGGTASRLGIKVGDAVRVEVFSNMFSINTPPPTTAASKVSSAAPNEQKLGPAASVEVLRFSWTDRQLGFYQLTLKNKLSRPIRNIKYVVIFYDSTGTQIHSAEGEYYDTILGNLAKTLEDSYSCHNGCLPKGVGDRTARVEIRMLDYQLAAK